MCWLSALVFAFRAASARKDWIPKKTSHRLLKHSKSSKAQQQTPTVTKILRSTFKCFTPKIWEFFNGVHPKKKSHRLLQHSKSSSSTTEGESSSKDLEVKIKLTNTGKGNHQQQINQTPATRILGSKFKCLTPNCCF